MRKTCDVVVALDTCVDLLLWGGDVVPEFGQKEKLIDGCSITMGGSTCIFACQAARLGLKTAGVGAVGDDDFGRFMRSSLARAGVDVSGLRTDTSISTGMGFALCAPGGDRAILTYLGSADAAVEADLPEELVASSRHIHVGSYYLMRRLSSAYPRILETARKNGVSVSLDPNWDPREKWDGVPDLLPWVDILLPNENEACALARERTADAALEKLAARVPIVVMKQGPRGSVLRKEKETLRAAALDVQVVDTVGAGDSFDAGYVWGHLCGLSPAECLRSAAVCGSLSTRLAGGTAGQADAAELRALLDG